MSLLMDALKKAELAKRNGIKGTPGENSNITLIPKESPATPGSKPLMAPDAESKPDDFPTLPVHHEDKNQQPRGNPLPSVPEHDISDVSSQGSISGKAAAPALLATKQRKKSASWKFFAIAIGIPAVLGITGINTHVKWPLQPDSSVTVLEPPSASMPPSMSSPRPAENAATAALASTAADPDMTGEEEKHAAEDEARSPVAPGKPRQMPAATAPVSGTPQADSPVQLSRTPLRVNPWLARAFDAFGRNDLAAAHADYERVLSAEPRNTDALHGMAAIAVRRGHHDQAESIYQRVIEANPQDSTALAALINMKSPADPVAAESRLKSLVAGQPDLAAPNFALGNLYARQARWEEAQQAYFRAYAAEPDNPDILHNLAVSLEHLRQPRLAFQYYGLALAATETRSAGFDKAATMARLHVLQP